MTKLKGQGMPVDSVESARAWRTERQNIAQRKPEPPPAGVRLPVHLGGQDDGPDADDMLDESFERARIRHKIAEANLAELEEARIKGLHVEKTRVEMGFFEAARGLRDGMTNCSRRIAAEVAQSKIANLKQRETELMRMREMVDEAQAIIASPTRPMIEIGTLMRDAWQLKRDLADGVSTSEIDTIFEAGLGYTRGVTGNGCGPNGGLANWNAWTSTNVYDGSSSPTYCAYTQPMLSDIEVDDEPRIAPSCASDFAQTTKTSAIGALEIHILEPRRR